MVEDFAEFAEDCEYREDCQNEQPLDICTHLQGGYFCHVDDCPFID